jgi:hypothetical protein
MRPSSIRFGIWLTLGLMIWGCGTKTIGDNADPPDDSAVPTQASKGGGETLLPAAAMADDVLLRQRVTIRWEDREERFDSVLQKRGSTLTLLGLGPMNRVGFVLTLADQHVTFENRSGREMPFQPARILADVQRVFYPWLAEDSACLACRRQGIRMGLDVEEQIGARFLEERRFGLVDHPDGGEVVIRYDAWEELSAVDDPKGSTPQPNPDAILVPKRVVVTNGWFGYELIVETMSGERITIDSTP